MAYWQRLNYGLGLQGGQNRRTIARVSRPKVACAVPSEWKQASLDASGRGPGSPDGLWRREDGKKLAQSVCGGRVYPDQKLG